ncbi:ribonuclease H1/H2 small subunit protein [Toxoplasma gondii ARI]|uniref:Ribonuclease H1/H2 small subunit protein n=1 Tax=Toxoplasma gondii ARI TaxID=1074872 RepID=A0A139XPB2_TOXGO|nr:ribonuclease H1/H2 small subunit protein [Toxoplasma gondii ARI]
MADRTGEGPPGKPGTVEGAVLFGDSSWWEESSSSGVSAGGFGICARSRKRTSPSKRTASSHKPGERSDPDRKTADAGAAEEGASSPSPTPKRKRKLSAAPSSVMGVSVNAAAYWSAAASQWRRRPRVSPASDSAFFSSRVFGDVPALPRDERLGGVAAAHLLPCKISFTGNAPVRRHFRPQVAYAVLGADEAEVPEAQAKEKEDSDTVSTGVEDSRESENLPPASQSTRVRDPNCASPRCADASLVKKGESGKAGGARQAENGAAQTHPLSETAPVVLEALLHGRLLRGLSLPLSHHALPSKGLKKKPEGSADSADASPDRGNGWFLTEGCEGFVVAAAPRQEPDEQVEIDDDDACEEANSEGKTEKLQTVENPPVAPRKELIPLGALSHLCYWQQETLPSPTDDVMQLLSFMRLATAMHDWRDEMPTPETTEA